MKKELLKGLTDEQIEKARSANNAEELLSLAKKEGVELTDEQLEAVSGGACTIKKKCPKCGGKDHKIWYEDTPGYGDDVKDCHYKCKKCGYHWIDND